MFKANLNILMQDDVAALVILKWFLLDGDYSSFSHTTRKVGFPGDFSSSACCLGSQSSFRQMLTLLCSVLRVFSISS